MLSQIFSFANLNLLSVSSLTGSAEPDYGPEAFSSVYDTVPLGANPYGELTRTDLEWRAPWSSHVETQTFYFTNEATGHYGFFQIIHSNPVGLMFTAQFLCLISHDEIEEDNVWTSTALEDFEAKGTEFNANECYVSLNEAGDTFKMNSNVCSDSLVNISITRDTKGFKIGETGTSLYGTDKKNPWGSMSHGFWPRCTIKGSIAIKGREAIDLNARGMVVMAMQGMKPHHAAARWNFTTVHSPKISAVVMEFVTPESYGSCQVGVAGVTHNGELLFTSSKVDIEHQDTKLDEEVGWSPPQKLVFDITGPPIDQATVEPSCNLQISGDVGKLVQRIDVMAEIPAFVKRVVAGIAGARPFIYQFSNKKMKLKLTLTDGQVVEEEGHAFSETTFIS